MTALSITTTSPTDWTYVSEGGANIVLAYKGASDDNFSGSVLRLRAMHIDADSSTKSNEPEQQADDPSIAFQKHIISKLISPAFLPRLEAVDLDEPWLRELAIKTEPSRPLSRRTVQIIDAKQARGVLASDLIGSTGWAVEIKPKWGFLPRPYHLLNETRLAKSSNCRFCMHTYHRSMTSNTTLSTHYCPLDLYSGEESRVRKALQALCDAWVESDGSLNNLKIFAAGKRVSPSNASSVLALSQEINPSGDEPPSPPILPNLLSALTDQLLPFLINTQVLHTLSKLQRTLDPLDIDGLVQLWNSSPGTAGSTFGTGLSDVKMEEWVSFLQEYASRMKKTPQEIEADWTHPDPTSSNLRYYLVAYLLSATFKDCSVIIQFQAGKAPSAAVIDLDPKQISRLSKWQKQDADIVRTFVEAGETSKPPCIDEIQP